MVQSSVLVILGESTEAHSGLESQISQDFSKETILSKAKPTL